MNEHCLKCVGVNDDDEQFEPSFTFFPNYQSPDVIDEFTLMSIQPNDQFMSSSDLPLDSGSFIDVNNEIPYDTHSFPVAEPNTQSVPSS